MITKSRMIAFGSVCSLAFFSVMAAEPQQQPAPTVSTMKSVKLDKTYAKKYAGIVKPIEEVAIIPRITGIIEKIHFTEGQMVKKGDLLFEFEDVSYQAKVDAANATIKQLEAEERYVQINFNRQKTLRQSDAVSQSAYDQAEEAVATIQARILAAQAELRDAENTLSYTKIYSPITGMIGKTTLTVGNLVTPSSGTLVTVTQIAPIYVQFAVGERTFRSEFGGIKGFAEKAQIQVELADNSIYPEEDNVAIIEPTVDKTTNTVKIWSSFANNDNELIPGSYVTVHLGKHNPGEVVGILPSALQVDQAGTYIYVLDANNVAQRREIVSGDVNGNYLEVTSGVEPGETVVVDGMHKIQTGVTVQAIPVEQ